MIDNPDWMTLASCTGLHLMFFPEGRDYLDLRAVRQVCAGCPVQEQCARLGQQLLRSSPPISHGVWGGLTVPELRRLPYRKKVDSR